MPRAVKLLLDEDVHLDLAEALRRRGYDAIHVREVRRLGFDDEEQLSYAITTDRCFFTFNIGDFVTWHTNYVLSGKTHCGIVVSAQIPLRQALRKLLTFLQTHSAEEVNGQLFFV